MGEKVQRVGNAILTVMVQEINEVAYAGGLASDRVIEKIARAAIAAMREPTESMLAVFADGEDPAYAEDWRTLIDAALATTIIPPSEPDKDAAQ